MRNKNGGMVGVLSEIVPQDRAGAIGWWHDGNSIAVVVFVVVVVVTCFRDISIYGTLVSNFGRYGKIYVIVVSF